MNLDVNKRIFDIWKKYNNEFGNEYDEKIESIKKKYKDKTSTFIDPLRELLPITYKLNEYYIKDDDKKIHRWIFAGFNPSLNKKHYEKNDFVPKINNSKDFFSYPNNEKGIPEKVINVDFSLRNNIPGRKKNYYKKYFGHVQKFIKIVTDDNRDDLDHVHIDPFFIRGTNQSEAKKVLGLAEDLKKNYELNGFAEDQLKLFEDMIKSYDPTAIIILNASSAHLLSHRWGNKEFNSSFRLEKDGLNRIRVFCGGMLFGSGGLDTYSKQRFANQISRYLKENFNGTRVS